MNFTTSFASFPAQVQETILLNRGDEWSWQAVNEDFPIISMSPSEQRKLGLRYCWDACGNCYPWEDEIQKTPIEGVNWVSSNKVTYQKPKQTLFNKIVKVLTYKLF